MKWNKWTIGLIILAAIGGYYWYNLRQSKTGVVEYVTAPVERGMITSSVSGSGNVIVDQSATVDPTITGTVTGLSVAQGDFVKKGQLLFSIVNDQLSVDVARATASNLQTKNSIDSAYLNRKEARSDYVNAKKKDKKDGSAFTQRELQILKQRVDVAEQNIDVVERNIIASRLAYFKTANDAKKRQVLAPIDGTVNEINIKNGDDLAKISSGNTKLSPMILGDLTTIKASVKVNEVDIPKIAIGQKAEIKFSALDDVVISGKVEKIDSLGTVTQGVVMYTVQLSFDTLDERIKPNMSVSSAIINDTKEDAVMIPNSALKSDAQGAYVEVLSNNVPRRQRIETGISNTSVSEVLRGVNVGDKVVTQTIDPNAPTTGSSSGSFRIPGLGGGGGR
ncbi:MAG: efflux RND transporter periplasmic adaptor subunit [Candidatus Moranbacteria bacterium]|nr:efflux RND transporter periplasmic adaptor subunit [Candidatus Moranbacteria bacterium]